MEANVQNIDALSNIVRMVKDYRVSNDERTLFDWLVFTQRGSGVGKPFRHSIPQVKAATNVTRFLQGKLFAHFVELGFLKLGTDVFNNNTYRSFFVDYSALARKEVLSQIVHEGTETFSAMLKMFAAWAKEQARGEKPLTKKEKNAKEAKLAADRNDYIDQGEALEEVGMNYRTFVRYCHKLGIKGERKGRCTYYSKQQIEMFKSIFTEEVKALIRIVEKETGKTLILEDINLNKKETPLNGEEMDVEVRLVSDSWYQPNMV